MVLVLRQKYQKGCMSGHIIVYMHLYVWKHMIYELVGKNIVLYCGLKVGVYTCDENDGFAVK